MKKEPVAWSTAITQLVEAIIPLLLIFGVLHWNQEQIGAVILAVGIVVKFVGAVVTRNITWSAKSVDEALYSTGEPEPQPFA